MYNFWKIWRWCHNDVMTLTPYWGISVTDMTELAAVDIFEQKQLQKRMTPCFLTNTLEFSKNSFPAILYDVKTSKMKFFVSKMFSILLSLIKTMTQKNDGPDPLNSIDNILDIKIAFDNYTTHQFHKLSWHSAKKEVRTSIFSKPYKWIIGARKLWKTSHSISIT